MSICEKCNKPHDGTYGSDRFCSSKCARGFSTLAKREEINSKVSRKLRGKSWKPRRIRLCSTCGVEIHRNGKLGLCKKCVYKSKRYRDKLSKGNKGNTGGYRERAGRSKCGYYKGIYCGSTYELVWVIFRLDHNLPVVRFEGFIEGDGIKYFPDFLTGQKEITEIKGYHTQLVDKKKNLATECGYTIKVLYKKDLKEEFKWVSDNYVYNKAHELYDDYKPLYTYICTNCSKEFCSDVKKKTSIVFCCQRCAGLYRVKVRTGVAASSNG